MNPVVYGRTRRPAHRHRRPIIIGVDGVARYDCGHEVDPAAAKRGRNNRTRGGKAELEVAKLLGGQKVGPLGLPEDVRLEGYARLQVKKLARLPSLASVAGWMNDMPAGGTMRGVVVIEAGRNGRRLIVFDLDEFAAEHGS